MNTLFKPSSFLKNFSALFAGLVVVQVINFIFSLVLPKYFSPAAFAEFGIFTSFIFIGIEIVNAKLDIVVMLGKTETETKECLNAAFTIALITSGIFLFIEILFAFFVPPIYFLLPLTILIYGIHQPILVLLNKLENYTTINTFRIIQVLSTCIFTLALGILKIEHALIYGFIIGLTFATLYVLKFKTPKIDWQATKTIWKKYDQFPKFGTWSSLFNNISRNSVPIVLSLFFTPQFVGFYSYATRLLNAPTGMFTSAIGQVYFKKASIHNNAELKILTKKIISITFLIAIIPSLFILFFGKELFLFLFNGEWMQAGKIAQYLILWYLLGLITSPISCLLDIKNKLKFELVFNVILFFTRIGAIAIGGILHHFYFSILLFSIIGIVMNLYLLYYLYFSVLEND